MSTTKAPITCHVLDTSLGRPAANVRVRLELVVADSTAAAAVHFESSTNADGRIGAWAPAGLEDAVMLGATSSRWTLRFDTAAYFAATGRADASFFPEVAVTFEVRAGEHYHVPLLLSPFGYSTYRGS